MIKSFEELRVWKKAYKLVTDFYECNIKFPDNERYGLESQLKRSLISVPGNIAEGCKRQYKKEFVQFLFIAKGSLSESRCYLMLCKDLGYLDEEKWNYFNNECINIDNMIDSYIQKILSNK
ncbi:MAG: four helix bundle protein [Bacillota bacterium]